jgi:hypothetical protein
MDYFCIKKSPTGMEQPARDIYRDKNQLSKGYED